MSGIGELEVFQKRTPLVILAAMALRALVCLVTLGPWVVAHAAPDWWLAEQTGWRLTRAEARWEVVQITGWVAIAASPPMFVALGMAVWRLTRRRPVLRIDEQGIWCRFVRQLGIIPWSDISGAFIATGVSGRRVQLQMRFLCLKLREVAAYRARAGRAHRLARDHLQLPDFHIMGMMGATPSAEEVEAFINAAVAGRGRPPLTRSGGPWTGCPVSPIMVAAKRRDPLCLGDSVSGRRSMPDDVARAIDHLDPSRCRWVVATRQPYRRHRNVGFHEHDQPLESPDIGHEHACEGERFTAA